MTALAPILGTLLLLQAQAPKKASPAAGAHGVAKASEAPSPAPGVAEGAPAAAKKTVILFLVDNSASLPPLDPAEQRVAALEKMFSFLKGQPYRLVLFGAKREIFVDDPSQYDNRGQWTDLYFAFEKVREDLDRALNSAQRWLIEFH